MVVSKMFRRLAVATAVVTYVLVVMGGLVRTSGSGLGCPDWPLCHGQALPLAQLHGTTLIEFSHRMVATLVTVFVLATAVVAWRRYRDQKWIFRPVMLAVALLALQIILGGLTVLLELPPAIVSVHLGNALILFAALITAAMFALRPWPASSVPRDTGDRLPRLALASTIGTYILILSGTVVAGTSAEDACPTWPLCNGQIIPSGGILPLINATHRYIAGAIGLLILYTLVLAWRTRSHVLQMRLTAIVAGALFLAQASVGAINVLLDFPLATDLLHLATATAVWASMVVFTILAFQTTRVAPAHLNSSGSLRLSKIAGQVATFFSLTKPLIVALLLATTFGAMVVAQRGLPPLPLLFFTLLGGALTAGGASTLNSYVDRDIDPLMGRTSRRPLSTGKIAPRDALVFGLALCVVGVVVLAVFVNVLSAALALIGIIYYAGIYTVLLKRSTPQNVVIGGAAGAIPPLVGWAAVTNHLNLLAIYLFLIIFYWTPPHTWALMLMVTRDYERVRVPMLPVARGESETRRQIVLYSLLMVAITLIPFSLERMGVAYLIAALVLGGWFIYQALALLRDQSKRSARRLYHYSNAYLALLFLAMAIDHLTPNLLSLR
jgi:protoheme IX farnesyltransferase